MASVSQGHRAQPQHRGARPWGPSLSLTCLEGALPVTGRQPQGAAHSPQDAATEQTGPLVSPSPGAQGAQPHPGGHSQERGGTAEARSPGRGPDTPRAAGCLPKQVLPSAWSWNPGLHSQR